MHGKNCVRNFRERWREREIREKDIERKKKQEKEKRILLEIQLPYDPSCLLGQFVITCYKRAKLHFHAPIEALVAT